MKKLFTFMAVALMGAATAGATITVKNGDQVIKDGDVITMTSDHINDLTGTGVMFQAALHLNVVTTRNDDFEYYVNYDVKGDSGNISVCGDNCVSLTDPDGDGVFTAKVSAKGEKSILMIDGPMSPAPYPAIKNYVDIVATDANNDKLSFRVVLDTTGESSVNGVVADKAVFSVKNGKAYVNGSANGVEVYNLLGQRVPNDALHGIYLVKAGKAVKKVVVK